MPIWRRRANGPGAKAISVAEMTLGMPLRHLEQVILTPHVAGITYQAAEQIARLPRLRVFTLNSNGRSFRTPTLRKVANDLPVFQAVAREHVM